MLMALDLPFRAHPRPRLVAHGRAKMRQIEAARREPDGLYARLRCGMRSLFPRPRNGRGQDATFSHEAFVRRNNSDLANDLGNGEPRASW